VILLSSIFLSPAFAIAGLALASIPIIIHFLNRRRFKVVHWAAMEFLLRAMKKNQKRLRFEQWLLLLVRCLVVLLLGTALARPMGCSESSLAFGGRKSALHVFVIDNSYSMAYQADRPGAQTHLDQARKLAGQLIDRFSAGGEAVAIFTAGDPAGEVIATPTYDLDAAKMAMSRIKQSYCATDLAGAMQKAADLARTESRQPSKNLYIFTDGTRSAFAGSQAESLKQLGPELAKLYHVTHFNLGRPNQSNAAIADLHPVSAVVAARMNVDFAATVRGYGNVNESTLRWFLDDQPLPTSAALHPASDTPDSLLPQLALRSAGAHVLSTSISGGGDRLAVDDSRARVIDVPQDLKVLIVEGERGVGALGSSGTFLKLALAPAASAQSSSSYVAPELISDLELPSKILSEYRAVILTNVPQIAAAQADALANYVKSGGALLMFTGEAVSSSSYNATMLPRGLLPGPLVRRMTTGDDGQAFTFDFKPNGNLHPFLEVFRGEEKSGLDTARIFTYWQIDPVKSANVERILEYSANHDPAITVHNLGAGKIVFVSTSSGADGWTSLPAKLVFVSLVHELLDHAVRPSDDWLNLPVGRALELPASLKLSAPPALEDPAHQPIALDPATLPDGRATYRSPPLTQPGIYHLTAGRAYPVAVTVPANEADVRTLDNAAIRRALGDADFSFEGDDLPPPAEIATAGNDYGWIVLLTVLGLAALEAALAFQAGHYRRN